MTFNSRSFNVQAGNPTTTTVEPSLVAGLRRKTTKWSSFAMAFNGEGELEGSHTLVECNHWSPSMLKGDHWSPSAEAVVDRRIFRLNIK